MGLSILVVGGGGREHALCWKLAQSKRKPTLFCAPGNAGTAALGQNVAIAADDVDGLLEFARRKKIDLTIVGPEDALCAGIVDSFESAGLRIFGPSAAAAKLEGDKSYAKQLMRDAGVPTAEFRYFEPTSQELAQARQPSRDRDEMGPKDLQTGYEMAREYVATRDEGLVVKACGLAKGKGVFVHPDPAGALITLEELMIQKRLGAAGERIVVEELLTGPEVSVLALIDGNNIYLLESAADHKRLRDGDKGPNTGGMGAYCPADALSDADLSIIQKDVFVPIIDALRRDGIVYRGVLYAGMMLTTGGPKVLEFNCRFGDPETQPMLMRLESDLVDVIEATLAGRLDECDLKWDKRAAACVVMASAGYPESSEKGRIIKGLDAAGRLRDVQVFHAATQRIAGDVVTDGGRVLGITALGDTMAQASAKAYEAVDLISFDGAQMRRDIGRKHAKKS
jgi:phosphoribosylamine--glycine ligase